jgi:GNAT superfamily N-acetyltransferase
MAEGLEPLNSAHRLEGFDSGKPSVDQWLRERALQAGFSNSAKTFVLCHGQDVIAFHSLTVGEIINADSAARLKAGMGNYSIPVLILARMAVRQDFQGRGLGKALLRDVILRAMAISEQAGVRALISHPVDEAAKQFYLQFGFAENLNNPKELYLLLKDAKKLLS